MGDNSLVRIQVNRPLYNQEHLNRELKYEKPKPTGCLSRSSPGCRLCDTKNVLYTLIPVSKWLPNYKFKRDFSGDLISGFTVAVMHIPQGMAYSLLGNVPAIVGIYMALFPVAVYFFLGTSKHISMGTFAVVCLMTGKAVLEYSDPAYFPNDFLSNTTIFSEGADAIPTTKYNYTPMEVVSAITFLVALFQILMFIFRLGVISSLLSEALISGFTTAAAIQVLTSQLQDLFGISIPKHKGYFAVINTWKSVFEEISNTNLTVLYISVVTISIVVINNEVLKPKISKMCSIPLPIELIAVIVGASVSHYCQINKYYNVSVVGHIPKGLPEPTIPNFSLMTTVVVDALTIAIVSYALALSMALIFAQKLNYEVDANQELLAMGAGNILGSFFSCMPFTASISRSLIQQTVGGKTQLASLISCGILFFVIMWIGPLFEPLPKCVLASVIVVSLKGMLVQVVELATFWKLNKLDALVWCVTFLTVVLVSIDIGLLIGLLLSLATITIQALKPYTCLLGVAPNTDFYLDVSRYRQVTQIHGIKIFHYRGGINFATRTIFKQKLYDALKIQPQKDLATKRKLAKLLTLGELNPANFLTHKLKHKLNKLSKKANNELRCLILDFSAVSLIDPSGVSTLKQISEEFHRISIRVFVAACSGAVFDTILNCNLHNKNDTFIKFFPTIHDAVESVTQNLDLISHV